MTKPNKAWVTDITYIRTWQGWLYLAVVTIIGVPRTRPERLDSLARLTSGRVLRQKVVDGCSLVETVHPTGTSIARHSHSQATLTLVLAGRAIEQVEDQTLYCETLSLLYRKAGVPHTNEYHSVPTRSFVVALDPAASRMFPPGPDWCLLDVAGVPTALALRAYMAFTQDQSSVRVPLAVEEILGELLAGTDKRVRWRASDVPRWIRRVRDRLNDAPWEPLTLSALATEAGVHPVYLARIFRRCYGCSVGDYLHARRIDQAVASALGTDQRFSDIASTLGYFDQSHFTRVFTRLAGVPPMAVRNMGREGQTKS